MISTVLDSFNFKKKIRCILAIVFGERVCKKTTKTWRRAALLARAGQGAPSTRATPFGSTES